ncbi:MAG TPA: hypothetical protein DCM08_10195 [Microscillaceae bacterium]|nr:hypothetical protein [Microscillaceae bacterium]
MKHTFSFCTPIFVFLFFLGFGKLPLKAQNTPPPQQILTLKEFYQQITANHPIVKQAGLLNRFAQQEIRMMRGAFDPKLEAEYENKQFDDKNYFDLLEARLKAPIWIGEVKAGYELNRGQFLNPALTTPENGLLFVGITVPIGQGLLIDARRATLRQAEFLREINEAERIKEVNKVLIKAAKDYWEWYFAYQQYLLFKIGYDLANVRFRAVKERVLVGDLAGIDSVEAKITLQDRDIQLKQAALELQNARLLASNYLWGAEEVPLEIPENIIPQEIIPGNRKISTNRLDELLEQAELFHPEVVKLNFKLKQLTIEERLQKDRLKPRIDFSYNLLSSAGAAFRTTDATLQRGFAPSQNFKWGFNFEFPLFLRKERSKIQQVLIKQDQTDFERTQTIREIQNNVLANYNELMTLAALMQEQELMVDNYQTLRDAELRKFDNGESSLFLINARESKLIESQVKLEALKSKYEKAYAALLWSVGATVWD